MKSTLINLLTAPFFLFPSFFRGQPTSSIHQFSANSIEGKTIEFKEFKGKKIIVVNTASECGLTPQFKELQEVYDKYKDKGLIIIGFPTNDFAHQDPGTNTEIHSFCERNYGVTFLMMEKISVKGDSIHPIYKWLTSKSLNGVMSSTVKWNFQKYLIDENGFLAHVISPWKKPNNRKIIKWLAEN
ncbi:MAG: glutathione peroxidase [Bacteroidota bacterium]|nr:glutathione peroxidase [Bacteroidota bacterium]MDP3145201.1 glutathione peroxidase [Bacteroidota bacterium]MDP3557274.1 glutathione peroxidase [Bacteroidota bacterium]